MKTKEQICEYLEALRLGNEVLRESNNPLFRVAINNNDKKIEALSWVLNDEE